MDKSKCIKLFECCIPVQGAVRALICDLQRGTFDYISIGLYEILTDYDRQSLNEIYEIFSYLDAKILDEYFEWLIKKEYIFLTDEPYSFPSIDTKFETPEIINNAIIDIDENSQHDFIAIFSALDKLGCKYIEIRSYVPLLIEDLLKILTPCNNLRFRNIDVITKYISCNEIELNDIFNRFIVVSKVIFHSAPITKNTNPMPSRWVVYTKQMIISEQCCGKIGINNFSINIETYLESKSANTCLNKKVSIDKHGNIKNCPSLITSFGNISNNSIIDVVVSSDFQKTWKITKDQINVCKVCEYRYICTDCRAFQNNESIFDKPVKCNYNPYSASWEN